MKEAAYAMGATREPHSRADATAAHASREATGEAEAAQLALVLKDGVVAERVRGREQRAVDASSRADGLARRHVAQQ